MNDVVLDEIRQCQGCSEWRHVTNFGVGRRYCGICDAAHAKRIDDGLRAGTFSPGELMKMSFELPRPIAPEDGVAYVVDDDVPALTTEELNMMFMAGLAEEPPSA